MHVVNNINLSIIKSTTHRPSEVPGIIFTIVGL